jgi:AraC family transcriptional regulator
MPPQGDTSSQGMRDRIGVGVPSFRRLVMTPLAERRSDETFVDAVCDPPETFTYGGIVAC